MGKEVLWTWTQRPLSPFLGKKASHGAILESLVQCVAHHKHSVITCGTLKQREARIHFLCVFNGDKQLSLLSGKPLSSLVNHPNNNALRLRGFTFLGPRPRCTFGHYHLASSSDLLRATREEQNELPGEQLQCCLHDFRISKPIVGQTEAFY